MKNMDRTSWIGVIITFSLLIAWSWWSMKETSKQARQLEAQKAAAAAAPKSPEKPENSPKDAKISDAVAEKSQASPPSGIKVEETILENDFVRLHLTNAGGGIQIAELKKHPQKLGDPQLVSINETAAHPVGTISPAPKQFDDTVWNLVSKSDREVVYETTDAHGLEWRKTFRLPEGKTDPYAITLLLDVKNGTAKPVNLGSEYLYAGSAAPRQANEISMHIGSSWMGKDGDFSYKTVDSFGGSKFLGIFGGSEKPYIESAIGQLHWAAVNDQFFATIFRAMKPYEGDIWISRFPITLPGSTAASGKRPTYASETALSLPKETLAPEATTEIEYEIYLGPKEYARLKALGDRQQRVMHYDAIPVFGWLFGWAIKPLASFLISGMVYIKGIVGNYGIAIILVTLLIRLLIWPVYAKSTRTMKRMSKLTPLMKEIREKYADNPEKMNRETMQLYQTYGVNPLGGCLPMFIQLPVFLAFYRMLWSAAELRQESFLWVKDLSMPDTLFTIPGIGIDLNPLPIIMGVTSFIQIAITPKTGDKTQQTIFMLMPLIFIVICYNFAAALALYWTTSNVFTIFQTWVMNRLPEPELTKRTGGSKKGFMQRMAEKAETARKAQAEAGTPANPALSRTRLPSEKGERHTKGKKKRR